MNVVYQAKQTTQSKLWSEIIFLNLPSVEMKCTTSIKDLDTIELKIDFDSNCTRQNELLILLEEGLKRRGITLEKIKK